MFKKMKIKPYLLMVFSLIIVLAVVITVVGIVGLIQTKASVDILAKKVLIAENAVKSCRIEANIAARNLGEMILSNTREDASIFKEQINTSVNTIKEQMEILKNTYGESDGAYARYESAFNDWLKLSNDAIEQVEGNNRQAAKSIVLDECAPALKTLAEVAIEIEEKTIEQSSLAEKNTERMIITFIAISVVIFLLVISTSIYFALKTTFNITGATDKIKDAISELSKGNLNTSVDYVANNEFGELAENINFSFHEISKYINAIDYGMSEFSKGNFNSEYTINFLGDFENIKKSFEKFQADMSNTLLELDSASNQVGAGADQVALGSQTLAQGAEEQASSIQELSANITEITNQISQTAEYSRTANDLGKQAGKVVLKSQSEVKQMVQAIKDIAVSSENIQKIIKAIDDIAFQTNILALNAAVEAARAGTAGKGFAVVADEVRNLAQKSADAAKDTAELIENSIRYVSHGEKLAENTNKAFGEVAKVSDQILGMIEKIAATSNDQAKYISQISQSVDQISSVVQTNSATSQESAAASEELSGQVATMKSLINQFELNRSTIGYTEHTEDTEYMEYSEEEA